MLGVVREGCCWCLSGSWCGFVEGWRVWLGFVVAVVVVGVVVELIVLFGRVCGMGWWWCVEWWWEGGMLIAMWGGVCGVGC